VRRRKVLGNKCGNTCKQFWSQHSIFGVVAVYEVLTLATVHICNVVSVYRKSKYTSRWPRIV